MSMKGSMFKVTASGGYSSNRQANQTNLLVNQSWTYETSHMNIKMFKNLKVAHVIMENIKKTFHIWHCKSSH